MNMLFENTGIGPGVIAGIVLGVLLFMLVILAAVYVLRKYDINIVF